MSRGRRITMSKVVADISMSLDGFITGQTRTSNTA